jgi:hypothetical protein
VQALEVWLLDEEVKGENRDLGKYRGDQPRE